MRILIFENEKEYFESIFAAVNLAYFDSKFYFDWKKSWQEISSIDDLKEYNKIFVDLDLSRNSTLDGYSIIIKALDFGIVPDKLVIFTGSDKVKETLLLKGIPEIRILAKPPLVDDIRDILKTAQ